jgi:beta-lactamase class A
MSVADLCAASVEVSDNAAANLLLRLIGGPADLTAWLRRTGDGTTRLDRDEPSLNTNLAGDPRDTTTPDAFVATLRTLLLGDALTDASRARLVAWMVACESGRARLRAGLPSDWRFGDKTGTGEGGAVNDVAIAWPPGRPPILIAVLMSGSTRPTEDLAKAHAKVARTVAAAFMGS